MAIEILEAQAEKWPFEIHVTGLGFPEGPVALGDGRIAFVDLLHQKIRIFGPNGTGELCSVAGSPNGMRLGPDGALYVANNGGLAPERGQLVRPAPQITGRIQRVTLDGSVADFAVDLPGERPWRPNDLVFSQNGDIVFTDPQNWEVLGDPENSRSYLGGQLLLASPDGAVKSIAKMTGFPNGLVFHPDGSLLVGLTTESRIVRFEWLGDRVGHGETWIQFDHRFAPDGMAFHNGLLYITGSVGDRIAVVDTAGALQSMIDCGPGSDPTNLCIHDGRLWVTFGVPGQLVSYQLPSHS
jgi:sugar lactone lactonase YvrE